MVKILYLAFLFFINSYHYSYSQKSNKYDFDKWSGKNGIIKSNIEIPDQIIEKHKMTLAKGSMTNSCFFKIPMYDNDSLKKGRLEIEIFNNIEDAQKALVDYLDCLVSPIKPSYLKNKYDKIGDVVFGEVINGEYWLYYTKNNVLVVINAPAKLVNDIATELEKKIQDAPIWESYMPNPSINYKLTK